MQTRSSSRATRRISWSSALSRPISATWIAFHLIARAIRRFEAPSPDRAAPASCDAIRVLDFVVYRGCGITKGLLQILFLKDKGYSRKSSTRSGCVARISSTLRTVIRIPRMHGLPPHLPGSTVMRSNAAFSLIRVKSSAFAPNHAGNHSPSRHRRPARTGSKLPLRRAVERGIMERDEPHQRRQAMDDRIVARTPAARRNEALDGLSRVGGCGTSPTYPRRRPPNAGFGV